jgi:hypothetical protein
LETAFWGIGGREYVLLTDEKWFCWTVPGSIAEKMYHLVKGYYQYYKQPRRLPTRNILILGLDNAGKSTLLEMIKSLYSTTLFQPEHIRPTIGQNIGRVTVGEVDKIVLAFWDLGGQEGLRKIWEEYYKESDALIFVVDATDRGRIEECKDALGKGPIILFSPFLLFSYSIWSTIHL